MRACIHERGNQKAKMKMKCFSVKKPTPILHRHYYHHHHITVFIVIVMLFSL